MAAHTCTPIEEAEVVERGRVVTQAAAAADGATAAVDAADAADAAAADAADAASTCDAGGGVTVVAAAAGV